MKDRYTSIYDRIGEQYPEPPDIPDIFAGAPRGKVNTPARFLRVLRSRFSQEFPTIYRTLSLEPMCASMCVWILFNFLKSEIIYCVEDFVTIYGRSFYGFGELFRIFLNFSSYARGGK